MLQAMTFVQLGSPSMMDSGAHVCPNLTYEPIIL